MQALTMIDFQHQYLNRVSELYLHSRQTTFAWVDSSRFSLSDFENDTQGERIQLALYEGEVVGFISIWEADAFIHHLFVKPGYVGKGIGSALLNQAKKQYRQLSLKCLVQNVAAVDFYQAHGFRPVTKGESELGDYYLMQSH